MGIEKIAGQGPIFVIAAILVLGGIFSVGKAVIDGPDMSMPMDGWQFVVIGIGCVIVGAILWRWGWILAGLIVGYVMIVHVLPWLWRLLTTPLDPLVR